MIKLIGVILIALPIVVGIITANILPYYFVYIFFKLKDYVPLLSSLSLALIINGGTLLFIADVMEDFVYKREK